MVRLDTASEGWRLRLRVDASVLEMRAISELAERHALSTYDAAYLELAARQGATLITLDKQLAAAATSARVAVHAPGRTSAAQLRGRYNI